ncbi:MAG: hypothetical protein R6U20_11335 [Longimonas sp.]|uniref:hypothetical protein n=1 Tax=Longimonas sp. TaxID=2039626 RepID=UPI0039750FDF
MIEALRALAAHPYGLVALAAGSALVTVLVTTPLVIRLAKRMGWVAYPREDRWHATPTALMGGIGLVGAAFVGGAASGTIGLLWPVWVGGALLFATGMYDDLKGVPPAGKLIAQIVATALLMMEGYLFMGDWHWAISGPLTFLWVAGVTNAINLLDNMDGLAAGVAGIAALVMLVVSVVTGLPAVVGIMAAVAGATAGFLVFNFKPAKIFMGDCGSLFLGYMLGAVALVVQTEVPVQASFAVMVLPFAVLAVPIMDTTMVMIVRRWMGRPVSKGGRDHTSHRLVFLGLSEAQAVLTLYAISAAGGVLALALLFVDTLLFYALSALAGVSLTVFGVYLARANVYAEEDDTSAVGTSGDGAPVRPSTSEMQNAHLLFRLFGHRWKAVFGVFADSALLAAAFVMAHYLRFEQGLTPGQEERMLEVLPLLISAKIIVFSAMGMYRAIWRHAGTPEIVRTIGASVLASGVGGGVWGAFFSWETFSVSVWIIDWMIVTLSVVGVRFGFRGLRQYFLAHETKGPRVVIYGANDSGALLLREIRQNPELAYNPVGFVDDDPLKEEQRVQGLPVLGTGDRLAAICRLYHVEGVLLSLRDMDEAERAAAIEATRPLDIPCHELGMTLMTASETTDAAPSSPIPSPS